MLTMSSPPPSGLVGLEKRQTVRTLATLSNRRGGSAQRAPPTSLIELEETARRQVKNAAKLAAQCRVIAEVRAAAAAAAAAHSCSAGRGRRRQLPPRLAARLLLRRLLLRRSR